MINRNQIQEHMEVIGADGVHIGTVDHLDGERIKLTKNDSGSGGRHHYLPISMIEDVDGGKARMSFKAELVTQFWEAA